MEHEYSRIASFNNWQWSTTGPSPIALAKAGFFYLEEADSDTVQCFSCKVKVSRWETRASPIEEHYKLSPNCEFLKSKSESSVAQSGPNVHFEIPGENVSPAAMLASIQAIGTGQPAGPPGEVQPVSLPLSPGNSLHYEPEPLRAPAVEPGAEAQPSHAGQGPPSLSDLQAAVPPIDKISQFTPDPENTDPRKTGSLAFQDSMRSEKKRLETYYDFPESAHQRPSVLAAAGFFYVGSSDHTQCAFCRGVLRNWEPMDDPMAVHRRYFSECPFVNGKQIGNIPLRRRPTEEDPPVSPSQEQPYSLQIPAHPGFNVPSSPASAPSVIPPERLPAVPAEWPPYRPQESTPAMPYQRPPTLPYERPPSSLPPVQPGPNRPHTIPHVQPVNRQTRHPQFETYAMRLATFHSWSTQSFHQKPEELAEAGFYHGGHTDHVRCFHCDIGLTNWEAKDIPWVEHAFWSPRCLFLINEKGEQFITGIRQAETRPFRDTAQRESPHVKMAMDMGYSLEVIKKVVENRIKTTGRDFEDVNSLLEALFLVEEETSPGAAPGVEQSGANALPHEQEPTEGSADQQGNPEEPQEGTSTPGDDQQHQQQQGSGAATAGDPQLSGGELQQVLHQNEVMRERHLCKVCMDAEVNVVFLPCAHLCCCNECGPKLRKCPICRQPIRGTVRIFIP